MRAPAASDMILRWPRVQPKQETADHRGGWIEQDLHGRDRNHRYPKFRTRAEVRGCFSGEDPCATFFERCTQCV